jgi:hypothetical protein
LTLSLPVSTSSNSNAGTGSHSSNTGSVDASFCAFPTGLTTSSGSAYAWFTGPFSQCSGGQQQRTVSCRGNVFNTQTGSYAAPSSSSCAGSSPSASQAC